MGASQTLDSPEGSPFEAIGVPGVIDDIFLRHGTRVVVDGVCMQPDTMHPFFGIAKEVNIQFTLAQTPDEFAETLRVLTGQHRASNRRQNNHLKLDRLACRTPGLVSNLCSKR